MMGLEGLLRRFINVLNLSTIFYKLELPYTFFANSSNFFKLKIDKLSIYCFLLKMLWESCIAASDMISNPSIVCSYSAFSLDFSFYIVLSICCSSLFFYLLIDSIFKIMLSGLSICFLIAWIMLSILSSIKSNSFEYYIYYLISSYLIFFYLRIYWIFFLIILDSGKGLLCLNFKQ